MSANDQLNYLEQRGCFPHQVEFAANWFALGSAQKQLLVSYPGLGKRYVAAAIVSHAYTNQPASRILVLCPSALTDQWRESIRQGNSEVPVLVVDRRYLRELDASRAEADSLWPSSAVVLLSIDFAKQEDVSASLAKVEWDMLLVDEVQNVKAGSQRYNLIAYLFDRSPNMRVLFLRSSGGWGDPENPPTFNPLLSGAAVTVWSRNTVRDHHGRPLLPEVQIEWITHHRKPDEVAVLARLQESLRAAAGANSTTQFQFIATNLMLAASSSLFTLEQRLRRIRQSRNEIAHGIPSTDASDFDSGDEGLDETNTGNVAEDWKTQLAIAEMASQFLPMIDRVQSDSKLEVLLGLLETLGLKTGGDRRVCIFTKYVDTATYLATTLGEHYLGVAKLYGALSVLERNRILHEFAREGGVLIVTELMSSTIAEVAGVIFYDLPLNPAVLDARIGQFVRVGRPGPVRVIAFADESNALVIERLEKKVAEFKKALGEHELQEVLFSKDKA